MYHGRMQGELGPPSGTPDTRLTYDDFLLFPDDGPRHEIIPLRDAESDLFR